jgi:hypothetical protein
MGRKITIQQIFNNLKKTITVAIAKAVTVVRNISVVKAVVNVVKKSAEDINNANRIAALKKEIPIIERSNTNLQNKINELSREKNNIINSNESIIYNLNSDNNTLLKLKNSNNKNLDSTVNNNRNLDNKITNFHAQKTTREILLNKLYTIDINKNIYHDIISENNTIIKNNLKLKENSSSKNVKLSYITAQLEDIENINTVFFIIYYLIFFIFSYFIINKSKSTIIIKSIIILMFLFYPIIIYTLEIFFYNIFYIIYLYLFPIYAIEDIY